MTAESSAGASAVDPALAAFPEFQTLEVSIDGPVLTITINRPQALNALSRLVLAELAALLEHLIDGRPPRVRGVIMIGVGDRAFVAGADIREMAAMTPDEGEAFGRLGQRVTELVEVLPIPVIACVSGYALGGGCELAMAADYIFCTEQAVFGQPEVTLGLIPGFGGCVRLQRLVGPGRAKEMIYTGRRVGAAEAYRIGLVNEIFVDRTAMVEAARRSIDEVAARSPAAVAICKSAINGAVGRPTEAALDVERRAFRAAFTNAEMREGTQAFLEKRPPVFTAGTSEVVDDR